MSGEATEFAPAKVNLTLHVLGKRPDGYHELESLVVFSDRNAADRLTFTPGPELKLDVTGPTADVSGPTGDNLVLKAVRLLGENCPGLKSGHFTLEKKLPVAAGVGGGSSDAAAALRLIARHNGIAFDDPRLREAARLTGADVPVCLEPVPRMMRGVGEILSAPVPLPALHAVLINPGVAVPTAGVFKALAAPPLEQAPQPDDFIRPHMSVSGVLSAVGMHRNDLEDPAIGLQPVIDTVLTALRQADGCRLARMSGSGATCFGIFHNAEFAQKAAQDLGVSQSGWWVRATVFGG